MTLHDIDTYFRKLLQFELYNADPSKNGIQVQNIDPSKDSITKIAFAVDACLETIEKTVESKAQMLVVHHGIFWGHEQTIIGNHYDRIKKLIDNNIALYACHIPLDANEEVGNNYGLAKRLGLNNLESFGCWNNMHIGVKGAFEKPLQKEEVEKKLQEGNQKIEKSLFFGSEKIQTVAIVSGGAEDLMVEAAEQNIDLFITGELSHESYHTAKEKGINVIAGGHYNTETIGVSLLAQRLQEKKGIETVFIDVPTGL